MFRVCSISIAYIFHSSTQLFRNKPLKHDTLTLQQRESFMTSSFWDFGVVGHVDQFTLKINVAFYICLVLVQPRITGIHHDMTEKLLTGL